MNQTLFPGQQADEKIFLVIREHWSVLFAKLALWFLMLFLYLGFDYVSLYYAPQFISPTYLPLVDVLKVIFVMFLALGLFIILTLYYLHSHIITNERIVTIEQKSLTHHTISELHLNQIQDVTAEVHGLPENLLDFGDVYIQTAGETERFLFHNIPNPVKVTKLVIDLYEQLPEQRTNQTQAPPQQPQVIVK
ncbi:MAG TPA: hypothetical protein VEC17_03440 [Candidatus Binatia bacterium]|nr:hypothetical protein [Candidatus Binatia bacterium]